jgi:hypothetical protein
VLLRRKVSGGKGSIEIYCARLLFMAQAESQVLHLRFEVNHTCVWTLTGVYKQPHFFQRLLTLSSQQPHQVKDPARQPPTAALNLQTITRFQPCLVQLSASISQILYLHFLPTSICQHNRAATTAGNHEHICFVLGCKVR